VILVSLARKHVAGRLSKLLAIMVAGCLSCPLPALAQKSSTAAALRAAFLYNFTKFTEWPADVLAPGQRLALCVADAGDVADALE
jgi:YfiR/HmsC-like